MEKKTALQTLIEWGDKMMMEQPMKLLSFADAIDKAEELLALEKEQIMYAYVAGQSDCEIFTMESEMEEYYNKTYNSKQ